MTIAILPSLLMSLESKNWPSKSIVAIRTSRSAQGNMKITMKKDKMNVLVEISCETNIFIPNDITSAVNCSTPLYAPVNLG